MLSSFVLHRFAGVLWRFRGYNEIICRYFDSLVATAATDVVQTVRWCGGAAGDDLTAEIPLTGCS